MSVALSLPAMRNFACCQTKEATSRLVKYLRAARPRANQNSEAPIIIVLSTSKNAAPVRSGGTAVGAATSAAAAEAAPATCARVSSSAVPALRGDRRPRNGTRGTGPPNDGLTATLAGSLEGRGPWSPGAQQLPSVTSGGRQMSAGELLSGTSTTGPEGVVP